MYVRIIAAALILIASQATPVHAWDETPTEDKTTEVDDDGKTDVGGGGDVEDSEFDASDDGTITIDLSSGWPVAVIGVVLILALLVLVLKTKVRWTPYAVVRITGLVLILLTAMIILLVPNVEVSEGVLVLLAAVAAYLLAKDTREGDMVHLTPAAATPTPPPVEEQDQDASE